MIARKNCLECKGRLWCGESFCPLLSKKRVLSSLENNFTGKSFQGSSPPSVFVSWYGYPKVGVSVLAPPFQLRDDSIDNPEKWSSLDKRQILENREALIRSRKNYQASKSSKSLEKVQEMVMSAKPLDLEIELEKRPSFSLTFSDSFAPLGPEAPLRSLSFQENPVVDRKVDYLVSDTHALAQESLDELFSAEVSVYKIHNLFSTGLLGVKKRRKIVPTRWAITAVDSSISSTLIEEVKGFGEIDCFELFQGEAFDNHFSVLLCPGRWSFEQLELWMPGSVWVKEEPRVMADWEGFKGRKDYASNVAGAYYAARLAIAEHLKKRRVQATAIVFREIRPAYTESLGVWVIREGVRKALERKPLEFYDLGLALKYLDTRLLTPVKKWMKSSVVLDSVFSQKKITDFF